MQPLATDKIQKQETLVIPAFVGGQTYTSIERLQICSPDGEILGELTLVPLIKAQESLRLSLENFKTLQNIPAADLFRYFRAAAKLLRSGDWSFASFSRKTYCRLVSASTGFPPDAMEEEIEEMADLLENLENIVRVQLPGTIRETLDEHQYPVPGNTIGYFPSGKTLLIKLPGNIPTICVYWLVPLTLKRPVILIPPAEDPFTHLLLHEALMKVSPELAACVHFLPCRDQVWTNLLGATDQLLLPESRKEIIERSVSLTAKTSLIHFGRTKLLICKQWTEADADMAIRRMNWKSGRTCTGLTSVVLEQDARGFAKKISVKLAENRIYDFESCSRQLPVFSRKQAEQLNELIENFIRNGEAEDISQEAYGLSRLIVSGEKAILLPTVLWVKKKQSPVFGMELPFPFITVIDAEEENSRIEYSRHSLILSVINGSPELLQELYFDTSIRKVFSGSDVERGYHYLDPHEGFLADFLYCKKAIASGKIQSADEG